ncbi:MAG TPA: hypothetical protein PKJ10_06560 [Smithella sp.]|nr:hypothetical protein [Smithella sp.]
MTGHEDFFNPAVIGAASVFRLCHWPWMIPFKQSLSTIFGVAPGYEIFNDGDHLTRRRRIV